MVFIVPLHTQRLYVGKKSPREVTFCYTGGGVTTPLTCRRKLCHVRAMTRPEPQGTHALGFTYLHFLKHANLTSVKQYAILMKVPC